ncbi:MAG: c-type cytochrome [Gammaproteobacteria bacterium]|nr:c-type cytochrome [Gammaproteobacteria bacterium]
MKNTNRTGYPGGFPHYLILTFSLMFSYPALGADAAVLLAGADAQRVESLLGKCDRCHGDAGVSDDPEIPHLVAQSATYLLKQLQHFKAGERDGGRMNKMIRKLDEQQLADVAIYFSSKSLPAQGGVTPLAAPALVKTGDAGRNIDACASCHGDDGQGKLDQYDAPALAGMPLTYFASSLSSFADESRKSDVNGVMGKVAKALSDSEVDELARYYLALGGRAPME